MIPALHHAVDPLAVVAALVLLIGGGEAWARRRPITGVVLLSLALIVLIVGSRG